MTDNCDSVLSSVRIWGAIWVKIVIFAWTVLTQAPQMGNGTFCPSSVCKVTLS